MILCTLLTGLGQFFLKSGMGVFEFSTLFANYNLILGVFIYGLATICFLLALQKGDLSVVFPLVTLSYIWVALVGYFWLGESLTGFRLLGIFFIGSGAFFLGKGAK